MPTSVRPSSASISATYRRSKGSVVRPLSARVQSSVPTSTTTRSQSMTVVGSQLRPSSALSNPKIGIQGFPWYKCTRSGALKLSSTKYTIPKWKSKSFLDGVQKNARKCPAPNSYKLAMSWKGKNAQIKGTKRITFTDEIKKQKKKIPGPNKYKNLDKLRKRIPNGKFDQTKGVNFLSECEFLSKSQPGPTKYENSKTKVLVRNPSWKWSNPK